MLFCLGASSVGMSESAYTRVTYDLTLAAARTMFVANPQMTFCFVSGVGTDSTERGKIMWARVKGKTENALLALGFKATYMFRPGYFQPIGDVQSKTGWVQTAYDIARPLYPLIHRLLPNKLDDHVESGPRDDSSGRCRILETRAVLGRLQHPQQPCDDSDSRVGPRARVTAGGLWRFGALVSDDAVTASVIATGEQRIRASRRSRVGAGRAVDV
jgi:hypothetical protein